jgi:DNA-binding MarR family transcriptional regulator
MSNPSGIDLETAHYVRDNCLCLHTQRAARALARRFDAVLKPYGLTNGQFSLMTALTRPVPHNMGKVAALLAVDRTTLTAALKPLSRRGLVEVSADPQDGRGRLLKLTPAGRELIATAMPTWRAAHAQIEANLGADPDILRAGLRELG